MHSGLPRLRNRSRDTNAADLSDRVIAPDYFSLRNAWPFETNCTIFHRRLGLRLFWSPERNHAVSAAAPAHLELDHHDFVNLDINQRHPTRQI